jgi:nitroreductase
VLQIAGAARRCRVTDLNEGITMDFQTVVNHRRMIRNYDPDREIPQEIVDRLVRNGLRAPSAGFSQGTGFLVLNTRDDIALFRTSVIPDEGADKWYAAQTNAPLIIVPLSNKDAYLDRYALPDKGFTDRSDAWWPSPYWDIDAGMASLLVLLTAVDEGLGACFFGMSIETIDTFRHSFGVPPEFYPIGAISIGYSDEPARDLKDRRRKTDDVVRYGRWNA